jgi:hypothetical protein
MLAYGTITISDEMRGSGIYKITTAPSSYTTTTGGFTPTYRIALATVKSQAGVTEVLIGDILEYSYYHYPVGYVDGSYVYLGPRVSFRGATGASATAYSLIVSHAAIVKAEDGTFTPDEITLTAKSQTGSGAMANYTGRLVIETTTDNSTWTNRYNQDAATYTYAIPSGIVAVRCSLYVAGGTATLLDQQIVPVVSDGTSGGKGEDAYTVILTNENHTFAGGTSAALAGSTTCNVVAYKGATQVAATIGTISGAPTGMSTTITSSGTTSAYFTVTVTTSMVTKNGVLTVPVTVDGKSFSMKFSYSLALAGTSVTISSITYATSTTETQPADSAFTATTAPTVAEGNWLWTKVTFSSGNSVYTKSKQGKSGTNGTSYYTFIRYSTNSDGNPMVETPTDDTLYIGVYTGTSSTAPTGYGSYTWSRYTGKDGKMLYGTCSTTASTAAKSVACADAKELYSGLTIMITFSTANTAAAPTLNVNSLGAKNIYFDGANASSSNLFLWGTGASIQFTYNGTAWVPVGHPCTYYGACTTAAGTAAKVSTINQVVVCKGTTVNLQMTNANTVASATLNISSTGAKTIYANGAVLSANSPYNWIAGSTVAFTFDGTYWRLGDTSANSKAVAAQTAADAAQGTADAALTSANGKNKVYHQASQPSGGTYVAGDTWFDMDDGYKMYTYNGSSWVAETFGTNAISDLAITNAKIADATIQNAKIATVDAGKITTGTLDAARIGAGSIAIGKLDTSTQTSIANGDAAKTAIDNLDVGGRNLARNTGAMTASDWVLARATVADSVLTMTPTASSSANAKYKIDYLPYGIYKNNEFTISFDCRELETGSYGTGPVRVCFMVQIASRVNSLVGSGSDRYQTFNLDSQGTDWHRYSITKKIPDDITLGQESALVDSSYVSFQFVRNASTRPIEIKNIKFELGNVATDWTVAPEDVDGAISTVDTKATDAAKTATNYITYVDSTNGIRVYDGQTANQNVNFSQLNSNGMQVYKSNNQVASFGDVTVLGSASKMRAELDYHSYQLIDKEGEAYFYVSDLRDDTGYATLTYNFVGDGTTTFYRLDLSVSWSIVSATIDGVATTDYVQDVGGITFDSAPASGSEIIVVAKTANQDTKAYTFGSRNSSGNIGRMSMTEGVDNTASGWISKAEGYSNVASGNMSHAEGYGTTSSSGFSHAEGYQTVASGGKSYETIAAHAQNIGTIASSKAQTALGKYNVADAEGNHAVIIGNGTNDSHRSDLLDISWGGNILINDVYSCVSKSATDIQQNADLDDYMTPGLYYSSSDVTPTLTNGPFASVSYTTLSNPYFSLCVISGGNTLSSKSRLQIAWSRAAHCIMARSYGGGGWTEWATIGVDAKPTFTVNTSNARNVENGYNNLTYANEMVIGTLRVTTAKQFAASTSYIIGTVSPHPIIDSVVFVRSGATFNIQGWISSGNGALGVQSGTAIASGAALDVLFIYKPA